jgi:hypothetical protein
MRLSRPVYESLPYVYMGLGVGALVSSFYWRDPPWSEAMIVAGLLLVVGGLVLVLKRRDYRLQKRRYGQELDEEE